jgi:hypothetical protein
MKNNSIRKYQWYFITLIAFCVLLLLLNGYLLNRVSKSNKLNNDYIGYQNEISLKDSFIRFYLSRSIISKQGINQQLQSLKLYTLASDTVQFTDIDHLKNTKQITSQNKVLVVFFPKYTCPTCYNLSALKIISEGSDFSILVISTLENIIDAKNSFSQIGIEANYFGYSPTVSMPLADYEDPCIFLWNYENKSYSNLLFFPKQVTKEMIGYYIGLIH